MMRVYVIYGQGGILTSYGMKKLADTIAARFPNAVVTTHSWKYPGLIVDDIAKLPADERIAVIGYSLGANCVTWVSNAVPKRLIDLCVCYDPSVLSIVTQPSVNVRRLLLYHNVDWEPEGHAIFTGPQVERTEISMLHLMVCYSSMLHAKTLAAIEAIK